MRARANSYIAARRLSDPRRAGKYQLVVLQDVGHCLQEDAPDRLAATLLDFWQRNDRTDVLKGVKKVGQA